MFIKIMIDKKRDETSVTDEVIINLEQITRIDPMIQSIYLSDGSTIYTYSFEIDNILYAINYKCRK